MQNFSRTEGRDRGRRGFKEAIVVIGVGQEGEAYPPGDI